MSAPSHRESAPSSTGQRRATAPCPVCEGTEASVFRAVGGYEIVTCAGCGLRRLDPQPTALELSELYDEGYFVSDESRRRGYGGYAAEAENWRRTFHERLEDLPAQRGRLLDVGAATGFFVEQATAAGWDARGIEPSDWAASYARDVLGVRVDTGTLESLRQPDSELDVVTMWEVIEHLPDPLAALREVHRILKPGGRLALSTPDARSRAARLSGRRWPGWGKVPEHLYFFDRANLDRLLRQAGFVPVAHRYASLTVTVGFLAERLSSVVGLPRWIRAPGWLAGRSVRFNPLYDLLVVAVRDPDPLRGSQG